MLYASCLFEGATFWPYWIEGRSACWLTLAEFCFLTFKAPAPPLARDPLLLLATWEESWLKTPKLCLWLLMPLRDPLEWWLLRLLLLLLTVRT